MCDHYRNNLEESVESTKAKPDEILTPASALLKFQENERVKNVRLIVAGDCCPVCAAHEGTYDKFDAPQLPVEGCSHPNGCRCFYEPLLTSIYP
jgi:hypothetical protein